MGLFSRLIARRSPQARLEHGLRLLKDEDFTEAFAEISAAAQSGLPEAQFRLGRLYLDGTGVPRDLVEGARWTRRAAQAGWNEARFVLATLYLVGLPAAAESDDFVLSDVAQNVTGEANYQKAAHWACSPLRIAPRMLRPCMGMFSVSGLMTSETPRKRLSGTNGRRRLAARRAISVWAWRRSIQRLPGKNRPARSIICGLRRREMSGPPFI